MKFGVTTYIWTLEFDLFHLPLLPQIKEGGFDGVEIPLFRPKGFPAAAIRKGVEANGLECTASVVLTDGFTPWPDQRPRGMRVVVGLLGDDAPEAPGWARSVRVPSD